MLASVQEQTYAAWQLVYIDDGSTDGSLEFMRDQAAKDHRILVVTTEGRQGSAHARNVGLARSTGEYAAFLDCDDWWAPEKLETQVREMERTGASFSCTSYTVCDSAGGAIRSQRVIEPVTSSRHLHKSLNIGCLTVMFRQDRFPSPRFDERLPRAEDYSLWYVMLEQAEASSLKTLAIAAPLAFYRSHPAGKSSNKVRHLAAHWRIYRDIFNFSLRRSLFCLCTYVFHGLADRRPKHVFGTSEHLSPPSAAK
jgi:teichuronic acid biosynthesis glycosyltransferase TuaG